VIQSSMVAIVDQGRGRRSERLHWLGARWRAGDGSISGSGDDARRRAYGGGNTTGRHEAPLSVLRALAKRGDAGDAKIERRLAVILAADDLRWRLAGMAVFECIYTGR
jgi:hypothetical protein